MSDTQMKEGQLTSLERYQEHVPGRVVLASTGEVWSDLQLRARLFPSQQHPAPAPGIPQHTLTIAYAGAVEGAHRTGGGAWTPFDTRANGHVTIRPAGWSTAIRWQAEGPVRTLSLYLMPERLEEVGLQMGVAPSQVTVRNCFNAADPVMRQIAENLRDVVVGERPEDPLYLQTTVQTLTVHLLREHSTASFSDTNEPGCLSRPRLHRVQRYVRAHLDRDLSLDDLAEVVGVSKYHFSRRFKKRTGQSPYQFVIYERVRAARRQLRDTTQPLAQVALNVGFSSQSHFTRTFKRHVGVTPGTYRAAWR